MKSKKIFMLLSLMAVIGISACESGAEAEPQSYVVSEKPETEITVTDKFSEAEEDISQCMSSLIALNSDENTVSVSSSDIIGASSEGGYTALFTDENGTLLRVQTVLFGAVGSIEQNYYILQDGRGYYTVLEKYNNSAQLAKTSGTLYYVFNEYYFDGESTFIIDRINRGLIPCDEDPVSKEIRKLLR